MSGEYASGTTVPISKSLEEIERVLTRFKAEAFGYSRMGNQVGIQFQIRGLRVLLRMTIPDRKQFELNSYGNARPASAVDKDFEQACRQRYRTVALAIKAKLALVDDGISTVEREFLADVMTPDGSTVGDRLAAQIADIVRTGDFPALIPEVQGAKIVAIGEGRR